MDRSRQGGIAMEKMYQFILWLVPAVEKFPRSRKFLLGDRIQATAMEIQEALIAATYSRKPLPQLFDANLQLEKLRIQMRLAYDLRSVDMRRYEFAVRSIDEIGRMVGGWIKVQHAEKASQSV